MIYEDIYRFLLNKVSSKEFDIVLNIINNVDWNSKMQIDPYMLAKHSGTTTRYVKEVLHKFTSFQKGKNILVTSSYNRDFSYSLLIGKPSLFYTEGDKYCRKFKFFYSKAFQNLSIYAKRILLAAAMNVSISDHPQTYLDVSSFIYRNEYTSGLIPSRTMLKKTLNEINNAFQNEIHTSLASNIMVKKEVLHIQIDQSLIEDVVHNYTERFLLRKTLFEHGYCNYLPNEYCIEMEKTAKYIFDSMIKEGKRILKSNGVITGLIDTIMDTARYVYTKSLEKFANAIPKFVDTEEDPKALSAYFSSVVFSTVTEEMAKWQNQADSIQMLMKNNTSSLGPETEQKYRHVQATAAILREWCENWFKSRVKQYPSKKDGKNEENIQQNNKLKDYLTNFLHTIERKIQQWENKRAKFMKKDSSISVFKDYMEQYLDFMNYRIGKTP